MKRKKASLVKVFLFILIGIILVISFVSSAQEIVIETDTGLVIEPVIKDYIKINEAHKFGIHVFNRTNGFPITTGIGCYMHLYSEDGSHLYEGYDSSVSHNFDYEFDLTAGNFSELGSYQIKYQCNDSVHGGGREDSFDVTYSGKELSTSQSIIYLGLLGILLFILFATFFGMTYLPKSNKQDESGRILSINHLKHFRLVLWLFAYFLFTAIIFLSSNVAFAFLQEEMFARILFGIFSVLMAISPVIIILIVISFFVKFYHDKEFQRMLNRGIYPEGKL